MIFYLNFRADEVQCKAGKNYHQNTFGCYATNRLLGNNHIIESKATMENAPLHHRREFLKYFTNVCF